MKRARTFAAPLALALLASAPAAAADPPVLPLKSVRLYETGVGYFERTGALAPGAQPTLPVPAGHLDDALKTLVVLSQPGSGAGTVRGVEFASRVSRPMARAIAGLPPAEGGEAPIGFRELLASLKGADVEVRTAAATVRGRLVDVVVPGQEEIAPPPVVVQVGSPPPPPPPPPLTVVVVSDRSEVVRFKAADVVSVRPLDAGVASRLGSALDALSGHGGEAARPLALSADGAGPITLGYVAETPVWRTTYRLVGDASGTSGVLQGWALIHNDTDEEWKDVRVELVNGRPDSFLLPLAAPRYARRELVHPDGDLSTVPQLVGRTVDSLWDPDSAGAGGVGITGTGEGGGGRGEGIGLGAIGTVGHGAGSGSSGDDVRSSTLLDVGNLAATEAANGVEAGALFTYALPQPVHLRAHGSLLVPFLQQRVDAERLAWFEEPDRAARTGIRLVNATPQTLPPGTIAFFADGGFAGESAVDRMKPGETRFALYGADLDVSLSVDTHDAHDAVQRLVARGDALEQHFLRTTEEQWTIENKSAQPRAVYAVLHFDRNARVTGAERVDFDQASAKPLAVFHVSPTTKAEEKMVAVEGLVRRTPIASLDARALVALAAEPALPNEQRAIVLEAAARAREADAARATAAEVGLAIAAAEADVARFRADLSAMGGARSDANNPFVARILAAEDRVAALRARIEQLGGYVGAKNAQLRAALARLQP